MKRKIVIGGSRFSSTMKYKWFFCVASATLQLATKSKEIIRAYTSEVTLL